MWHSREHCFRLNPRGSWCTECLRTMAASTWNDNNKLHIQSNRFDLKSILKLNFCQSSGSILFTPNLPQLAIPSILLSKQLCWSCHCPSTCKPFSVCAVAGVHHTCISPSHLAFTTLRSDPSQMVPLCQNQHFLFRYSQIGSGDLGTWYCQN